MMENKDRQIRTSPKFIGGVFCYFKVIGFAMPNI